MACLGTGCLRWENQEQTIDGFIQSVQDGDAAACYRLMAPELRTTIAAAVGEDGDEVDRFRSGFEALNRKFEADRESGHLVFTPDGIALVRALALGRGAFYRPDRSLSRTTGGHAAIIVPIVLPYKLIDRPDLARPGTVFWRLGRPFGRIYPVLFGLPYVGDREELIRIRLRIDLVECEGDGSPTGWCVLAMQALPETAEYQTVRSSSALF